MPFDYPTQIAVLADFVQLFAEMVGKVYYSDKMMVIKTIMKTLHEESSLEGRHPALKLYLRNYLSFRLIVNSVD